MPEPANLDDFTKAYIQAALWSSTDENNDPLDSNYTAGDLASATLEAMIRDCRRFQQEHAQALQERGRERGGRDFWLTRNGHGAGFWDGDWPEHGEELTMAAKKFREVDLYVGNDGYIYQGGTETPDPNPPHKGFSPTKEDEEFLKALKIKTAVYVEEQWEDILSRKGYVKDEVTETAWEDTLYINPEMSEVKVLLHEAANRSYYIVEFNDDVVEQGTDSEKLWDVLSTKIPELYRSSIKHPRELNENDMIEMGIIAHVKNALLFSKEPRMAFEFNNASPRQYDYEASGQNVVLISPSNVTRLLEGIEANDFWITLDHIESETAESTDKEYQQRVQDLIGSYFDRKAVMAKYVVKVDTTGFASLAKEAGEVTASKFPTSFVSSVVATRGGSVEKFRFTSNKVKAERFSQAGAEDLVGKLKDFRLTGTAVRE